jgi:predicted regulator of amino acid metabolism with ACT domain
MRKVKHNKIRNTGLLFEFLLRQITSDVLNKDQNSKAVSIVKQRFNENTELGKELALYNILITKKFQSDSKADYFINEVMKTRGDLNNSVLRRERYNLIKEIQSNYNLQKFMSSKVPNYKIFASIYKLFEYKTLSPAEKTESFFNIVEHVTTEDNNIRLSETVKTLPDDEDLRILTYKTLLEKFNQKYTKLSGAQKNLLREYINNVSNTNSLKDTLKEIISGLKKDLKQHSKNLQDDVVKIKMTEALKSINEFCGLNDKSNVVKDEYVIQTMRYLELLKELKKSGNKNKKVI